MDIDDDGPPLLVESSGAAAQDDAPALVDTGVANMSLTKVPITIVTGM